MKRLLSIYNRVGSAMHVCVDGVKQTNFKQTNLSNNSVTVGYWLVQLTMYVVMQHVLSNVVAV